MGHCYHCGELEKDCECMEFFQELDAEEYCHGCGQPWRYCSCYDNAPMPRGTDFHDEE